MTPTIPVPKAAKRTGQKGLRDLIVIAASSALLMLAEQAGDFGLPPEYTPIISALALAAYRGLRDQVRGAQD